MGIDFKRIYRWRTGGTKSKGPEKSHATDLPLDHQLSFNPDPGEQWQYREGHVYINGHDVNELVNCSPNDISFLSGMSFSLDIYQKYVWNRGGRAHAKFNGAINALQGKIIGRLGSIYEDMVGGVNYEFVDEVLWVNNVNIRAVLALYKMRPTVKAQEYLKGLRNKLFLIIARQRSNPRVNGMHKALNQLIAEIEGVLKVYTPSDTPLLVADTRAMREQAS